MPKFVFQLDGVLRQRKHLEQQRQRELAAVQSQMAQFQQELKALNEQAQGATADLRQNHLTGRLDMNFLAAHRRFMLATQRRALTLMQRMALVQRQVEEAQRNLADAAKQRKVIEKLREKHRERWVAALSKRELSEQDEIGMQLSYWHSLQGEGATAASREDDTAADTDTTADLGLVP